MTSGRLGTFAGVFTPSIVTILGIILFLRLGFVVGAAGIVRALVIIALANAISVLTSISLSAIATNLRVKGGGDYYLISRTLGVQFGGALGLVLYLAQAVSIAFYSIGFGEALATMTGTAASWAPQAIAAAAVSALFFLAWLGADWATRFQYVVMTILFAAILGLVIGGIGRFDLDLFRSNLGPAIVMEGGADRLSFWMLFAIFFPAVTGFTQGVSMSGDLKDPGKSLPLGTFFAVGVSIVVYLGVALILAGALPAAELAADYGAMRRVCAAAWLVDAGVIAATLSSALASFLGAPRILQSVAADHVFPLLDPFSVVHPATGNPRRGVLLSAAVAFGTIALGNLNLIASVVTMFFLISYGLLNYATYVETKANSPSFRPRFRFFHARLSLLGGLACLGVMLAINPTAGAVAVALLFGLYQYVGRSVNIERWADSERSRRFQRVRGDLYAISSDLEHPRYWRPVLLAFSDDPERRARLLRFASWVEGGSGLTTAVRIVDGEGPRARLVQLEAERELRQEIDGLGFRSFARAVVAPDLDTAVPVLLQSYGLGPVRANTVLLNWFELSDDVTAAARDAYARRLRLALRFSCNLLVLHARREDLVAAVAPDAAKRRIDVWHRDNASGRLMLLLAYLMTRCDAWEQARIRLLGAAGEGESPADAAGRLRTILEDARIEAEPVIVEDQKPATVIEQSQASSVVFLPLRLGDDGPTSVQGDFPEELLRGLGVTAFVLAAQDIELDSEPEAGAHGELARAIDAADKAEQLAEQAAQDAETAADAATAARENPDDEKTAKETALQAEQARRRAARARAKAEDARASAEKLAGG